MTPTVPATITEIRVVRLWETCKRTTYYVELISDEGYTMTPVSHRTGHEYKDHVSGEIVVVPGLSIEEARERAIIEAGIWGDFLRIAPTPYVEKGVTCEPRMQMLPYTTRRVLKQRAEAKKDA